MKKQLPLISLLAVALWLTGCAATGVVHKETVALSTGAITTDTPILVKNFDASAAVFTGDYSDVDAEVARQRQRVPEIISKELIQYLDAHGYDAMAYTVNGPANAVVVSGTVTQVDAGSGAARFWVGMGAGASQVLANVEISRATTPSKLLAKIELEGHSGGTGGLWGYQDWIGANSKDLAIRLGKYITAEDSGSDD